MGLGVTPRVIDVFAWVAALIGTIHLISVLAVSGIDSVTVRDIGLLGGTIALFWTALPETLKAKLPRNKSKMVM